MDNSSQKTDIKMPKEISLKTLVFGLQTSMKPMFELPIFKDKTLVCYTDDLMAIKK